MKCNLAIRQLVYCKCAFHKESWLVLLPWAPIWCVHMSPSLFAGHRVKGCNFGREVAQKFWKSCCFQDRQLCKREGQNIFIYMHTHAQAHIPLPALVHTQKLSLGIIILCMKKINIQPCFCVFSKQTAKWIHMCPFKITLLLLLQKKYVATKVQFWFGHEYTQFYLVKLLHRVLLWLHDDM